LVQLALEARYRFPKILVQSIVDRSTDDVVSEHIEQPLKLFAVSYR